VETVTKLPKRNDPQQWGFFLEIASLRSGRMSRQAASFIKVKGKVKGINAPASWEKQLHFCYDLALIGV
jgi:hypothetical protein